MKLLLFDLDGTLVTTGGAGLRALERAFLMLHRIPRAPEGIPFAGRTDPLIVRDIFRAKARRAPSPEEMEEVCRHYLWFLDDELANRPDGYQVMEGAGELLELLSVREGLLMALGTGNLEKGARIKLERAGFNRYFPFGGFGSDAEDRADMLRAAVRRAEDRAGRRFRGRDVFVIGDTILDVRAGKAIGAVTVAVANGHGNAAELRVSGPDVYLESLAAPDAFLGLIGLQEARV